MKSKKQLRTYKNKSTEIWHMEEKGRGYPTLKCAYKDKECSNDCAHFIMSEKRKIGQPIFCGKIQIGILA